MSIPVLPIDKFLSLVPIIQFPLCYLSSGRLWKVKDKLKLSRVKGNFKLLALKMVAVAYDEMWSLTRGPNCGALTLKQGIGTKSTA